MKCKSLSVVVLSLAFGAASFLAPQASFAWGHHHHKGVAAEQQAAAAGNYDPATYNRIVASAMTLSKSIGVTSGGKGLEQSSASYWRSDLYYKAADFYKASGNPRLAAEQACYYASHDANAISKYAADEFIFAAQQAGYGEACQDLRSWSTHPFTHLSS
jgi:hypothetical protein